MKRITGILFLLTLATMILINSCKSTADHYTISTTKCTMCLKCIPVCGFHAINQVFTDSGSYLVIDPNKCVGCGECVIACKYDAITSASANFGGQLGDD